MRIVNSIEGYVKQIKKDFQVNKENNIFKQRKINFIFCYVRYDVKGVNGMRITITSRNVDVSDKLKNLINKKMQKLDRYFKKGTEVSVCLNQEKNRSVMEVTVHCDGIVIRAEKSDTDMYSALDNVLQKLERRIRKHRTKIEKKLHDEAFILNEPLFEAAGSNDEGDDEDDILGKVVKVKNFNVKPMSVEEAILQMDLLGHSFFVFRNAESMDINVVYKRHKGDYGLIDPEYN